ncbi:MAG: hypothetical protein J1F18_03795 [Lachnospiraceae bacterium]|nr:hypothetical protein [Lachnospiraceae bacterium]
MSETKVQRNYKDTIFRMLFKDKENLLSLYNALNGTDYTDVSGLEVTTLENAVYMNYKNDVSFVFDSELMVYEHQSTVNPNMPLRDLFYVTSVLQKRIDGQRLYNSKRALIPAPRFVVFYNGATEQPEIQTLRLSDSYEKRQEEPELELVVTVYNINYGCNKEILGACRTLKEYAMYVEQVRDYAKKMPLSEAVDSAVDYCIEHGILSEFFRQNRAEVIAMCLYEFDEKAYLQNEREYWYESGIEQGIKQGSEEKNRTIIRNMLGHGMTDEDIRAIVECSQEQIEQVRRDARG